MIADSLSLDAARRREVALHSTGDGVAPAEFADQTWQTIEEEPEELDDDTLLGAGDLLGGRYRIGPQIGRGGMGRVYSGEHVGLGRPVAIKILAGHRCGVNVAARRFAAEGRAAAAVSHPGIVDVLDSGELDDGRLYLVMERIDGRTLAEELDMRAPLPWREACELVAAIANALAAAHRRGLIHRDLKPSNIMLSADDGGRRPKILDFGIAADISQISDVRMTRPGQLLGTPLYMAPEQADALAPTPQMDLYALGCILFHALTGAAPFADEDPFALVARKRRAPSPSLASARDDLPAALVRLVDRCLAVDPTARPHSAAAIEDELRALLADPEPARAAPHPSRGGARSLILGGALSFGLLVGLALLRVSARDPAPAPAPAPEVSQPELGPPGALTTSVDAPSPARLADAPSQPQDGRQEQQRQLGVDAEAAGSGDAEPEAKPVPEDTDAAEDAQEGAPQDAPQDAAATDTATSTSTSAAPKAGRAAKPAQSSVDPGASRCELVRRSASESRRTYNWAGVLRHTAKAGCWGDRVARTELRVKAHLELGNYRQCIDEGEGVADRKIRSMVTICARRVGSAWGR
ncbi:MAG: protein kinase [Nannocystaceae bacterium]